MAGRKRSYPRREDGKCWNDERPHYKAGFCCTCYNQRNYNRRTIRIVSQTLDLVTGAPLPIDEIIALAVRKQCSFARAKAEVLAKLNRQTRLDRAAARKARSAAHRNKRKFARSLEVMNELTRKPATFGGVPLIGDSASVPPAVAPGRDSASARVAVPPARMDEARRDPPQDRLTPRVDLAPRPVIRGHQKPFSDDWVFTPPSVERMRARR